jgi:hypothetical protein
MAKSGADTLKEMSDWTIRSQSIHDVRLNVWNFERTKEIT